MKKIEGGITAAKGFQAAGGAAGIKKQGVKDMALVYSEVPNPVLHGSEQLYFLTICRKMSNNAERFLLRAPPFQC